MATVSPMRNASIPDGTRREDLAVFLKGWRRYRALALREEPAVYNARVHPLLTRLQEHLAVLRLLATQPSSEFQADRWRVEAAHFRLFMAFSSVIDATKWLAGKSRIQGRPRSMAEAFDLLVQAGALPAEKRNLYMGLARLRNRIAHESLTLSPAKARALVRFWLPELEVYQALIQAASAGSQGHAAETSSPPGFYG